MKILIYISTIIIISQAGECILQKQTCKDLQTQFDCNNTHVPYTKCSWSEYSSSCTIQQYDHGCNMYFTKTSCTSQNSYYSNYECYWDQNICKKRIKDVPLESCESLKTYYECVHNFHYSNGQHCAWKHSKCTSVYECDKLTDFYSCRNGNFKDRCQYVVNNIPSKKEKEYFSSNGEMFENVECRNRDCVYQINGSCPAFLNGRQCFLDNGNCTQCSYMTTPSQCVATKKCTWQNSTCSYIFCEDITSYKLCQSYSYCQFNYTTQKCKTKQDKENYCYSYNIISKPKTLGDL